MNVCVFAIILFSRWERWKLFYDFIIVAIIFYSFFLVSLIVVFVSLHFWYVFIVFLYLYSITCSYSIFSWIFFRYFFIHMFEYISFNFCRCISDNNQIAYCLVALDREPLTFDFFFCFIFFYQMTENNNKNKNIFFINRENLPNRMKRNEHCIWLKKNMKREREMIHSTDKKSRWNIRPDNTM